MHIGVTGTRNGMNAKQREQVLRYFDGLQHTHTLHHGDCVGVDVQVAEIAKSFGWRVIAHPPENPVLRAWHMSDEIRQTKPYLVRNHDIVDESTHLWVVPKEMEEVLRSGVWSTHRYAGRKNRVRAIIWPQNMGR